MTQLVIIAIDICRFNNCAHAQFVFSVRSTCEWLVPLMRTPNITKTKNAEIIYPLMLSSVEMPFATSGHILPLVYVV